MSEQDRAEDHFENNPRRKGHSKLVAKDGKIETQRDSEAKQFSQAKVDALIATAYEDAAEVCRKILSRSWKVDAAGSDVLVEEDGTVVDSDVSPVTAIRSRTPGDAQKVLAEHDAALREKWDSECFPNQWINAKVEVCDKAIAKLEAENAELREGLKQAIGAMHALTHIAGTPEEILEWHDIAVAEARALLAKSGAPK